MSQNNLEGPQVQHLKICQNCPKNDGNESENDKTNKKSNNRQVVNNKCLNGKQYISGKANDVAKLNKDQSAYHPTGSNPAYLLSSSHLFNHKRIELAKAHQQAQKQRKQRLLDQKSQCVSLQVQAMSPTFKDKEKFLNHQHYQNNQNNGKLDNLTQVLGKEQDAITKLIDELQGLKNKLNFCQKAHNKKNSHQFSKQDERFVIRVLKQNGIVNKNDKDQSKKGILQKILQQIRNRFNQQVQCKNKSTQNRKKNKKQGSQQIKKQAKKQKQQKMQGSSNAQFQLQNCRLSRIPRRDQLCSIAIEAENYSKYCQINDDSSIYQQSIANQKVDQNMGNSIDIEWQKNAQLMKKAKISKRYYQQNQQNTLEVDQKIKLNKIEQSENDHRAFINYYQNNQSFLNEYQGYPCMKSKYQPHFGKQSQKEYHLAEKQDLDVCLAIQKNNQCHDKKLTCPNLQHSATIRPSPNTPSNLQYSLTPRQYANTYEKPISQSSKKAQNTSESSQNQMQFQLQPVELYVTELNDSPDCNFIIGKIGEFDVQIYLEAIQRVFILRDQVRIVVATYGQIIIIFQYPNHIRRFLAMLNHFSTHQK